MQRGKWICFPGDYAIFLAEKVQTRRFQRDFPIAPFWRMGAAWKNVRFFKTFKCDKPQKLHFSWEGRISVFFKRPEYHVDDWYSYDFNGDIELPAGEHYMEVWIYNPVGLPCLKIDGDEFFSDESILVGNNQIDVYPAEVINCGDKTPNTYALASRKIGCVRKFEKDGDTIYDFGKIIFAFADLKGAGKYKLFFGETLAEAENDVSKIELVAEKPYFGSYRDNASEYFCEQIEYFDLHGGGEHYSEVSKAFRYLRVSGGKHELTVYEEYDENGTITEFNCENTELKKIFDVSLYTFSVCAREFFLDGAKRDRWLWGGDAYEAQKAEYFYQYNAERIKNSITALFGKSPVKRYINHILDYTFYTIISVADYYYASGDKQFLKQILPILTEHIDFCIKNLNENGFIVPERKNGAAVDWVFVDWGKLPDKNGEVSLLQILLWKALKTTGAIYEELSLCGEKYEKLADELKDKINLAFWDEKRGAFVFAVNNGVKSQAVTCHANAFAVLYGFANSAQKRAIIDNFKNDEISLSETPFMIQFVLETLFLNGQTQKGDDMLKKFWGGMVKAGATTFWETYNEGETEETATAMYARPFGRSHCHIWGAGPLYVIPRFYFGIRSENFGERFVVSPVLSLVKNSSVKVPMKRGFLFVKIANDSVSVFSSELSGRLLLNDAAFEIKSGQNFTVKL